MCQNNNIIHTQYYLLKDGKTTVEIQALKVGFTEIVIYDSNAPNIKEVVKVNVIEQTKPTGISLDKSSIEITIGKQKTVVTIAPKIIPDNARNRNVIWKSSNEKVAKPDAYMHPDDVCCVVNPVGEGTCTFTASTEEGGYVASCQVIVHIIPVTSIEIAKPEQPWGYSGKTIQLIWWVRPYDATNKKVTWSSSDETIATVDSNGLVTLRENVGYAFIKGKTEDGGFEGSISVYSNGKSS